MTADRLSISTMSLYGWKKQWSKLARQQLEDQDLQTENARLKRTLKQAQQERDNLKEATVFL